MKGIDFSFIWPYRDGIINCGNTQGRAHGTPLFYYQIFYHKVISMSFCNITTSRSSTPDDILGEVFRVLSISARHSPALPTTFRPALLLPDPIFHRKKRDLTIRTQPACKVPSGRCLSLCYQDKKYYIYFKQN